MNEWKQYIECLLDSPDEVERESVLLGWDETSGLPLLVPRELVYEHFHILGDTGSGKTSRGLLPLLEQLICRGDVSVVVLDQKGDTLELLATLMAARRWCKNRKGPSIPIKHFSNCVGQATHGFNFMTQPFWAHLTNQQRVEAIANTLGLTYTTGTEYGESYFGDANTFVLEYVLERFPDVKSFAELAERIPQALHSAKSHELPDETKRAGNHVHMIVKRLSAHEALNVTEASHSAQVVSDCIDLESLFAKPGLVFCRLSSIRGQSSTAEMGRLFVYGLMNAASVAKERNHRVLVVIDEFQRMVSSNLDYVFETARSLGISLVLANQSMESLDKTKRDTISTVEANCRVRMWFAAGATADRRRLRERTGEGLVYMKSFKPGLWADDTTYSESFRSHLDPDELLQVAADPELCVVEMTRSAGYVSHYQGRPAVVQVPFHIDKEEYDQRRDYPWPSGDEGTIVLGLRPSRPSIPAPQHSDQHKPRRTTPQPEVISSKKPNVKTPFERLQDRTRGTGESDR